MTDDMTKGKGIRALLRHLCFIIFAFSAFYDPFDIFDPVHIGFSIIVGFFFGALFRAFLSALLSLFNRDLRQSHGKKIISAAVSKGMIFIIPFAVMLLIATFGLGWSMTAGFVSAAIMSAGVSSSLEVGKLKGKPAIKNTIITSAIAWSFSMIWQFSSGLLAQIPAYIEGGIALVIPLARDFFR